MAREEDEDSSIYTIVFGITIALFLFVAYQGYNRYFRKSAAKRPVADAGRTPASATAADDGYDRAPSSLPPLRVDKGVTGGRSSQK